MSIWGTELRDLDPELRRARANRGVGDQCGTNIRLVVLISAALGKPEKRVELCGFDESERSARTAKSVHD
jgi:hypothetical protein